MGKIVEIINKAGIELKIIGNGVWRGFCPFHNDGKTPNFTVYEKTDSFYCFSCNVGGNVINFISKFYKVNLDEAKLRYYKSLSSQDLSDILHKKEVKVDYKKILNKTVSSWIKNKFDFNIMKELDNIIYSYEELTKEDYNNFLEYFKSKLA